MELKDWVASKLDLMPYLAQQFDLCAFPDAELFIRHILEEGFALVLFDGLDEVNQEGEQRSNMIRILKDFAKRYPEIHICITCRIAASDYSFEHFTYLEIADFSENQVQQFARKWYQEEPKKGERFLEELCKSANQGLKNLTRTPLLLALLCLAFDQTLTFPANRTELYRDALDALLKKWDSSRNIRRDTIYRKLTSWRKEKMLSRIAAINFEKGDLYIPQKRLSEQISNYLKQLPHNEFDEEPDGDVVLNAIEAQHGILIEYAHNIYSFSHLTFQEFLTARYIIENAGNGSLDRLVHNHLTEDRWREVFLMTASMLDDASDFFNIFLKSAAGIARSDPLALEHLQWAHTYSKQATLDSKKSRIGSNLVLLFYALACAPVPNRTIDLARALNIKLAPALPLAATLRRAHILEQTNEFNFNRKYPLELGMNQARDLAIAEHNISLSHALDSAFFRAKDLDSSFAYARDLDRTHLFYQLGKFIHDLDKLIRSEYGISIPFNEMKCDPYMENLEIINQYTYANELLLDCLGIAVVDDRAGIMDSIFLPPTE